MIAPRWVSVLAQPIAISDLLSLSRGGARSKYRAGNQIFEIGGADRVSYGTLMREYSRLRGLRRLIIPVPVLTPRLSSLWLGLVTPLYVRVGRKLIDSIRHPSIIRDDSATEAFSHRAGRLSPGDCRRIGQRRSGLGTCAEHRPDLRRRKCRPRAPRDFSIVAKFASKSPRSKSSPPWSESGDRPAGTTAIGCGNCAACWTARRAASDCAAAVNDPNHLRVGDTVDCWRVEAIEPAQRLRLAAEMKLPGRAWLEFQVEPLGDACRLRQTAEFDPRGDTGPRLLVPGLSIAPVCFRRNVKGDRGRRTRGTAVGSELQSGAILLNGRFGSAFVPLHLFRCRGPGFVVDDRRTR